MINRTKYILFSTLLLLAQWGFAQVETPLIEIYSAYEVAENDKEKARLSKEVGLAFMSQDAFVKANEYLLESAQLHASLGNKKETAELYFMVSDNLVGLSRYQAAQNYLSKAEKTIKQIGGQNNALLSETYTKMVDLALKNNRYRTAFDYLKQSLYVLEGVDIKQMVGINNRFGYVLMQLERTDSAYNYFVQAHDIADQLYKAGANEVGSVAALTATNLATSLAVKDKLDESISYYSKALNIYESQADTLNRARTLNFLGAAQLVNGNLGVAEENVNDAINLAEPKAAIRLLQESYKILSEIYTADGDLAASQDAFQKHLAYKDAVDEQLQAEADRRAANTLAAEKEESALQQRLAEERQKEAALQQAKLEAEKAENELALQQQQLSLLEREKELQEATLANQELEKKRAQQALALAQQELEQQERQAEINRLQLEQEKQESLIREQELKEQERQRAIELLEAESALQTQKLLEEEQQKKYFYYAAIGVAIFLALLLFSLIMRSRANKQLKQQQAEISIKNEELQASEEELRQNMEELQATQEVLADQKEQLQIEHLKTTQSIEYALTIQHAILPTAAFMGSAYRDYFLLYRPKDVVSGDFYWTSTHGNKVVAAIIDCTGHGVPGAFMSVVGHNSLNNIINEQHILDPALILQKLHAQIRTKLNQEAGANNDGMDLGICVIENHEGPERTVTYAGAKHKLFYYHNNSYHDLKGDRKSIGGRHTEGERIFTNHQLNLEAGDILYLTTDGYLDQANSKRRSFGGRRFKELVESVGAEDIEKQEKAFTEALENHQKETEQRDDISLLVVKL